MIFAFISDNLLKRVLLVVNVIFVVLGGLMIAHGIYLLGSSADVAKDLEGTTSDGTLPIVSGFVDVVTGAVGIFAVQSKMRVAMIIYVALIGLSLISNLILLIVVPVAGVEDMDQAKTAIKRDMAEAYGQRIGEGIDFTSKIDKYMREEKCCGFSGNENENSFLDSYWYKNRDESNKDYVLPGACCIKSMGSHCQSEKDIQKLRKENIIYDQDCLGVLLFSAKMSLWLKVIQYVLTILMQIPLVGLGVVSILRSAGGSS